MVTSGRFATSMEPAVLLNDVSKTFGQTRAVDHLDLVVPRGALYGFIGPNGAGKTTTIRMMMSIIFPDAGGLSILGRKSALDAKDRIGYLPEERGVYRKMRVGAFLTYLGRLKGVSDAVPARARAARTRARRPRRLRTQALRGTFERHAAEGAIPGGDHPRTRSADPRRAVQRARPGELAEPAGLDHGRTPARGDDPVLHACHAARRGSCATTS